MYKGLKLFVLSVAFVVVLAIAITAYKYIFPTSNMYMTIVSDNENLRMEKGLVGLYRVNDDNTIDREFIPGVPHIGPRLFFRNLPLGSYKIRISTPHCADADNVLNVSGSWMYLDIDFLECKIANIKIRD